MRKKKLKIGKKRPEEMFQERLVRENRWEEFERAIAELQASTPQVETHYERIARSKEIKTKARKQCGYKDADYEKALYAQYMEARDFAARESGHLADGAVSTTFDRALNDLPSKADPQIENDWVMAHVAMARKSRNEDQDKPVIITGHDILKADHGPCPSRSAAIKLQYWANEPKKAFEALTNPMKKPAEGREGDSEAVVDDGIDELERALRILNANGEQS
jgi:hypothetical protein